MYTHICIYRYVDMKIIPAKLPDWYAKTEEQQNGKYNIYIEV